MVNRRRRKKRNDQDKHIAESTNRHFGEIDYEEAIDTETKSERSFSETESGEGENMTRNTDNNTDRSRNQHTEGTMHHNHSNCSSHDNPGAILVNTPLTNGNYFSWSHAMYKALTVKKKLKFIQEDFVPPTRNTREYEEWKEKDCLVTTWILNTIHKYFAKSFEYTQWRSQN